MKLPETLEEHDHLIVGDACYFPDMPNQIYHNSPGISSSTIRRFGVSQLHALEEEMEDSHALRFGSAAHALIVEGERTFNEEVACLVGSPYTKANKELKAEYESRGLTVISTSDRDHIYNMRNHLIPEGEKLLHPSENEYPDVFNWPFERALYWEEKGLLCKVKADVIRYPIEGTFDNKQIILVDYKTTQSVEPRSFIGSVKKYQYELQAAWYKRAFEKAGFKVQDFYFVAQEKKKPYASKIFKMKHQDMEAGWIELERLLGEYKSVIEGRNIPKIYNSPNVVEVEL
jgi:hypothetical protein|tara:strand:+ start:1304 stop:2164 length:861 start_codon:yes stop_codon:yes gene_type:complete